MPVLRVPSDRNKNQRLIAEKHADIGLARYRVGASAACLSRVTQAPHLVVVAFDALVLLLH